MTHTETTPFDSGRHTTTRRTLIGAAVALFGAVKVASARAQNATPEAAATPESASAVAASPAAVESAPLQLLFIQTASQGSWAPVRGQPGAFWLTLSDPSPQTIVIEDEPANAAGTISTALFFDSTRIHDSSPMQAVISAQTPTGEDVLVVSLIRASYEPTIRELTYVAVKLNDYTDQHGISPLKGQDANFTLPPSFGATTLFITNAFCGESDNSTCQFG